MKMMITILAIMFTIIVLDLLWLGIIAKSIYQTELKTMLRPSFSILPAILVYILLSIGIYFFVLKSPYITSNISVLIIGATFGLVVYGVYEFTNFSLINNWPLKIVIIDIIWGMVICGVSSFVGRLVFNL